jgi:hypothetical protein
MNLIGAGFGRSGTMSIRSALWAIQPAFPWWFPPAVRTIHNEIIWNGNFIRIIRLLKVLNWLVPVVWLLIIILIILSV